MRAAEDVPDRADRRLSGSTAEYGWQSRAGADAPAGRMRQRRASRYRRAERVNEMAEHLSPLDTMFLDLEQADDGATMHFGATMLFDPLPHGGVPSVDELREHLDRRLHELPRYRMRLSSPRAGRFSWTAWEPAPRFDIAEHVAHATLPAPGQDPELHAWVADFLSHRLDRRRPLWEMALLDGLAGGRWALVTKTHHCLVDGMGSVDVGRILLDAERHPRRRRPPAHWRIAQPHDDHGPLHPDRLVRGAKAGAGVVLHPGDTLTRAAGVVDLLVNEELIAAPECSLSGPVGATRDYAAVHVDLADIKAIKSALGGTVNDVILSISAGALRRLLLARGEAPPAAGLRAQIPVDVRTSETEALGNVLTSLFVSLPVAEADAVERHRSVMARSRSSKAGGQQVGGQALIDLAAMAPPVVGELMGRAMFGGQRVFNLTITNVRASDVPLYALGARLRSVLPYVPLFAGRRVGIAVVSYAGEVVFGLGVDRTSGPSAALLADAVRSSFDELRALVAPRRRAHAAAR
jgi:WS/DGAT/MGAT family acyltransferase